MLILSLYLLGKGVKLGYISVCIHFCCTSALDTLASDLVEGRLSGSCRPSSLLPVGATPKLQTDIHMSSFR